MTRMSGIPAQLETLEPRRMLTVAPVLAGTSTLAYTELHAPMSIDPAITVAYASHTTLTSATVKLTNYVVGQDVLAYTPTAGTTGNIVGSSAVAGTVITWTFTSSGGTATLAQFQAALRAVTFSNTSHNPSTTARSVAFQVFGGTVGSNVLTNSITVTAVNDAPLLTGTATLAYAKNQAATPINKVLTITDADNTTLASATVKMTNYVAGQDVLAYTPAANTTGNIVATSSVSGTVMTWTFTSAGHTATLLQFQSALRAVTYKNTAATPNTATRTVTYAVNDGAAASNVLTSQVTISYLNGASNLVYKVNAATGNQTATSINSTVVLGDSPTTKIYSATVKMTNYVVGQDVLAYTPTAGTTGNIVGSSAVAGTVITWTFTSSGGTATLAQFQAALRAVTYKNTSVTPNLTNRTVNYQFFGGTGSTIPSNILTTTITLTNTTFDGSYTGSFVGSVTAFGMTDSIPGFYVTAGQNNIVATVTNGIGTIKLPGLSASATGTGALGSNGSVNLTTSGGTIAGYGVTVQFTGTLKLNANHTVSGSGTWTIINSPGITGSGTWSVTRPAP